MLAADGWLHLSFPGGNSNKESLPHRLEGVKEQADKKTGFFIFTRGGDRFS